MDPVSGVASIITLLGASSTVCKHLLIFLREQRNRASDLRCYTTSLETLHGTLDNLKSLLTKHNLKTQQTSNLFSNLTRFLEDINDAERTLRLASGATVRGGIQSAWSRLEWSTSTKRWLKKFFAKVNIWHIIFSCDLQAIQLEIAFELRARIIGPEVSVENVETPLVPNTATHAVQAIDSQGRALSPGNGFGTLAIAGSPQSTILPNVLQSSYQPISIRAGLVSYFDSRLGSVFLRCGNVILRKLTPAGQTSYEVGDNVGCGVEITIGLLWLRSRLSLMIFVTKEFSYTSVLSLSSKMSLSWEVPRNARAVTAVSEGNTKALLEMFRRKQARPSDTLSNGNSLLHLAAKYNKTYMVVFLLENGANPNAANIYGDTPLHLAVREATDYDISRLLIENGADIGSLNRESQTPLHSFYNVISSKLIRSHWDCIDPDLQDFRGMTIAHYTTWTKQSTPADIKPFLVAQDVFLSTKDVYGRTVLHLAAQRGNIALVGSLLQLTDWSVKQVQDNAGRTPLHYATESTRVRVIDMLKDSGISADDVDVYGRTALHHSAAEGTLAAVKHLICTADERQLARKDSEGKSILRLACEHKNLEVVEYLRSVRGMTLAPSKTSLPANKKFLYVSTVKLSLMVLGLAVVVSNPMRIAMLLLCCWIRVQYGASLTR